MEEDNPIDAVYFYMGILEAYEAVGKELIGQDMVEDQVIPRMVYYVRNFLPEKFSGQTNEQLNEEMKGFLENLKRKIEKNRQNMNQTGQLPNEEQITMNDIWELRAAIFGYESVFLDVLGENVIQNYVFKRMADILSFYLPDIFKGQDLSLDEKFSKFSNYIQEKDFVEFASYKIEDDELVVKTNHCAFAKIHESEAYEGENTRFCPWGMIGNAILTAHKGKEVEISKSFFTLKGSITELKVIE